MKECLLDPDMLSVVLTWLVPWYCTSLCGIVLHYVFIGEGGSLVVEPRTLEREVGGSIPTSAVLCP